MPSLAPSALPLSNGSSTRRRSSLSDNGNEIAGCRLSTSRKMQLSPSFGSLDSSSPGRAQSKGSSFVGLSPGLSSPPLRTLPSLDNLTESNSSVDHAHHHSRTHSYMTTNHGSHGHHIHIPSSPLSRSAASLSDMTTPPQSRRLSLSPSSPPYIPHHGHHVGPHVRRPSIHHSHSESLIGSYEESLLSGRTSTPSSKPAVTFLARIGVLGTGENCPPKLKCPRHLSLEFEAVYYDWQMSHSYGGRGTPYVGMLDIEEYYTTQATKELTKEGVHGNYKKHHKKHSKSSAFLGYRIPQQGQIQIVISNPHRTAIKLFLIPYDLRDMPVGSRTFLRQKTVVMEEGTGSKGSLRQAAHLHVVSPGEGKYYLSKTIRVVFENRALDATTTSGHGVLGVSASPSPIPGSSRENVKVETIKGDYSRYNLDSCSKTARRQSSAASAKLYSALAPTPIVNDDCAIAEDEHVSAIACKTSKLTLSKPPSRASDMDEMIVGIRDTSQTKEDFIQSKKIANRRLLECNSNLDKGENENTIELITWGELYSRRLNNNV
ncbi:uncharacterized protein V1513DRAFT_443591 [Lipomyces chichibuensis]|uniref:uncharacterized protein n=1 Tax=Lipomyces chichibuensis TaxID=1546026 RepID=UPI0033435364